MQDPVTYVSQQAFAMSAVQQEAPIVSNSIDDAGGDLAAPPASFGSTISVGAHANPFKIAADFRLGACSCAYAVNCLILRNINVTP